MQVLPGWIVVHDADTIRKKRPEGKEIAVRAAAIDTIRPYPDGKTRAVLGIHGSYLHVTEDIGMILHMVRYA